MVSDMLNSVLEKEKETATLESQARERSEIIIAQAHENAKKILEECKAKITENEAKKIAAVRADSDESVLKASDEAKKQAEVLKSGCEDKLAQTIEEVKRIILN